MCLKGRIQGTELLTQGWATWSLGAICKQHPGNETNFVIDVCADSQKEESVVLGVHSSAFLGSLRGLP